MRSESIQRQIALVSYGSSFLRDEQPLDDWYRHGIFWNARLQFRAPDNTLLADDFTWWLGMLARSGAQRLTLHPRAQFGIEAPRADSGGHHIVAVHFADRYELWVVGNERFQWQDHPLLAYQPGQTIPQFPDAAYYAGDIDSYWRIDERAGSLDTPETDWKALTAAIFADLDLSMTGGLAPAKPVLPPGTTSEWAALPLFPASTFTLPAHQLLATLYTVQAKFANDTHSKNEGNLFNWLDEQGAAKLANWGERLDSWVVEVEFRCANECRKTGLFTQNTPQARLYSSQPQMNRESPAAELPERAPPTPDRQVLPLQTEPRKGTGQGWIERIALLMVTAVLSLLIAGAAILIAKFPWVSILGALPWALHVRSKRRKQSTS